MPNDTLLKLWRANRIYLSTNSIIWTHLCIYDIFWVECRWVYDMRLFLFHSFDFLFSRCVCLTFLTSIRIHSIALFSYLRFIYVFVHCSISRKKSYLKQCCVHFWSIEKVPDFFLVAKKENLWGWIRSMNRILEDPEALSTTTTTVQNIIRPLLSYAHRYYTLSLSHIHFFRSYKTHDRTRDNWQPGIYAHVNIKIFPHLIFMQSFVRCSLLYEHQRFESFGGDGGGWFNVLKHAKIVCSLSLYRVHFISCSCSHFHFCKRSLYST